MHGHDLAFSFWLRRNISLNALKVEGSWPCGLVVQFTGKMLLLTYHWRPAFESTHLF